MKTVVLFGGSFDPIHWGHMKIAQQALIQRNADEVWFVLNQTSPFKEKGTSFDARYKMVEMMIKAHYPKFKACRIDETLPTPSYAINTVEVLQKKYPDIRFEWLIGSDQIPKLHEWHRFKEFDALVQIVVYQRDENTHKYPKLSGDLIDVSSTEIRNGTSLKTHRSVLNYMMSEGLYLEEMLEHRLSSERFDHTVRVTSLALQLAECHNVSLKRVYLAAMFHDYCKENTDDAIFFNTQYPKAFDHAFAAKSLLSKSYYVFDKQVLKAIENHVSGTATNKIAQILFIADKCELGRNYDSSPFIDLSMNNLNEGFKAVKEANQAFNRKENE